MNASSRTAGRAGGAVMVGNPTATPQPLREQVADALDRLARMILQRSDDDATRKGEVPGMREVVRFLGQVASGWAHVPDESIPAVGAGFGSTVVVEDADTGAWHTYTLMAGPLIDIDAGQVTLASPIGQALLGCEPGAMVEVETPQRRRRLRVIEVRTLRDLLVEHGLDG